MAKHYIQHRDYFLVETETPGEALASLLRRKIASGCTEFEAEYFMHSGKADEGDFVPTVLAYWHLSLDERKVLTQSIRENYPDLLDDWYDVIVASVPEHDEY